ncbi:MAG TPA: TetR/AcrR family transcriptional regulator [Anaerolineae bacterium]
MPKFSPSARRALTEERSAQILDAAARIFAAKGFERATIADVARSAGLAEGTIYNYFKNKNDLLVSLPRRMIAPTIESVSEHLATSTPTAPFPPEQMLTLVAQKLVSTMQANAHIFRALLSALPSMKTAAREKYVEQTVMYATGVLEKYFQAQIEQGVVRQGLSPRILARAYIGMFFPFLLLSDVLRIEGEMNRDYDQLVGQVVPLFLNGILAQPAERKTQ